jgi:hypothetical protein
LREETGVSTLETGGCVVPDLVVDTGGRACVTETGMSALETGVSASVMGMPLT